MNLGSVSDAGRTGARAAFAFAHATVGLTPADLPARARAANALCRALCDAHHITIELRGQIPLGPAMVVANHLGYLDPLVLGALRPMITIGKQEVSRWPWIGPCAARLGTLWVDRSDPSSGARVLRGAWRALRAGLPVLNFPEGTTTRGDRVLPFQRGVFGLARHARVPVIPVRVQFEDRTLCWVGDDPFVPHYLRLLTRDRITVRIDVGDPLVPARHEPAEAFAARTRNAIVALAPHTLE